MIGRTDLPLIEWGEELRRAQIAWRRLRRRMMRTGIVIGLVGTTIAFPPTPLLVWNASASAPIGLYVVRPGAALRAGDLVAARLPPVARSIAADRRYLPLRLPVLKRVAAMAGHDVCARGAVISIDGMTAAVRRATDAAGRPMSWWEGCRHLRNGEIFLLTATVPTSYDGRYFGVTRQADVIGKAHLLWPR